MDRQYFGKTTFYESTSIKILSLISTHDRQILEWGCRFGDFTELMARKLPNSHIYAVEDDPSHVEANRVTYTSQAFRNIIFENAQLDEIGEFVKVRHLQLDLLILPFMLYRLGNREKIKAFFKDVVGLPASPRIIVSDTFQPENLTEKDMPKFWEERAAEIYRVTFWRELNDEFIKDFNFGEAKRVAQQVARMESAQELEIGKLWCSNESLHLITESDLEQIIAEVGFSHIFHEKGDAWGNSIFVIQK
jgi:phospholipid N-methyltransferase